MDLSMQAANDKMLVTLWDYDMIGKNDLLGQGKICF